MKKFYHATNKSNLFSVLEKGLKRGNNGVVYLTETYIDAVKFLFVKGIKNIVVFEIELDENEVEESFDHSQDFFKCKAFMYDKDIDAKIIDIDSIREWNL